MISNESLWDIRREGRCWSDEEAEFRTCYEIPDRPEIHQGKLYFNDEERLAVAACLLENLGIDMVVQLLGSPALWQAAVAAQQSKTLPGSPASISELTDAAEAVFTNLDRELDGYSEIFRRLDPELATRAVTRTGGRELAALLLLCPSPELGGKSALQLWAAGKRKEVEMLLTGK